MADDLDPDLESYDDEIEIEDQDDEDGGDASNGEVGDDGSEDEAGEEASGGQEVDDEQVRRPSRAQARFQKLANETRELKAELERIRTERTTSQTAETTRQTEAQERERLSQMDPEQRLEYLIAKQSNQHRSELQQLRFEMADSADKTAFESMAARNPVASKLRTEVEERLAELRRGGTTAPRETVLKYLIGERALANAGRAKGKAQRAADVNRVRQTGKPSAARGDVSGGDRRDNAGISAVRKRLENMQI